MRAVGGDPLRPEKAMLVLFDQLRRTSFMQFAGVEEDCLEEEH